VLGQCVPNLLQREEIWSGACGVVQTLHAGPRGSRQYPSIACWNGNTAPVTTYKVHGLPKYLSSEGGLGERASIKKKEK